VSNVVNTHRRRDSLEEVRRSPLGREGTSAGLVHLDHSEPGQSTSL